MSYINILLSIILGLIPEALFFSIFVLITKRPKSHFKLAFCLLTIGIFIIAGLLLSFNLWFYIVIPALIYILMKILFKETEFIDLFLLTIPFLLLAIVGYICFGIGKLLPECIYPPVVMTIINRISLIFILSALSTKLNKWYNSYKKLWNRRKGNKIKSITIRNISILFSNAVIIAAYVMLLILGR